MIDSKDTILREKYLGKSRLDFLVDDNFIEVKTPLIKIQQNIPKHIKLKVQKQFNSYERLVRHLKQLTKSLDNHQTAIILTVFLYNNKMGIPKSGGNIKEITEAFEYAWAHGVQSWTCNMKIDKFGVELISYNENTNHF